MARFTVGVSLVLCRRSRRLISRLLLMLLFLAVPLVSQTGPAPTVDDQQGWVPYESYHGGDVDSVNLSNGKTQIDIPLVSYPQRGGLLKVGFSLSGTANGGTTTVVVMGCNGAPGRGSSIRERILISCRSARCCMSVTV